MTDRCTCGTCPVHSDVHSPRGIRSQTAENASGVPAGGSGHSEPDQGFCNRVGLHNRCAALPDHGWANHDAGLTAHDMPTPRTGTADVRAVWRQQVADVLAPRCIGCPDGRHGTRCPVWKHQAREDTR